MDSGLLPNKLKCLYYGSYNAINKSVKLYMRFEQKSSEKTGLF